ncbi:DEAD/DEAH box helicase [uncultured Enterococcus sp.]|uniref:DEAD/DEAH box helicase n=1 Tax=uncultured Enterococcus sp. TaxID=167972 RepID=UPI002AA85F5F|nr:DEAD/DEAH box helicase [uncultured Enterococcus sp.]
MNELTGRKIMKKELPENINLSEALHFPAMLVEREQACCQRCGSVHPVAAVEMAPHHYYCPACLQLGRVDSKEVFYHRPENQGPAREVVFEWSGELTAGQQTVSDWLQKIAVEKRKGMIWAVTGAGKTEMLFETVHALLSRGARIGLASPRVDVCLELYPRLKAVFPKEDIMLLHGEAEAPYRYTPFVLCTTHQLLRFYQAFDLLIIDEVDAFPYVNEPVLQYAAEQAVKRTSALIYLTATPTKQLLGQVDKKILEMIVLPARYHRRKLPIPQLKSCFRWRKQLEEKRLPKELVDCIKSLMEKNNVLLFCPSIVVLNKIYQLIVAQLPNISAASVHSKDEKRSEKVLQMREKKFRLFLTTTILERGVTFEQVSVIVIGSEHSVFSESVLVQIAGRVDRKKDFTSGEVWFLHDGKTKPMRQAVKQIKKMNALAEKRGLVDELCLLSTANNQSSINQ